MPLVDERGRLLGRINLIDAFVAVLVLVLVPLGYLSYRLFHVPTPRIDAVEPQTQTWHAGAMRIRIHGENLRPYLRVFVSEAGEPFSLYDRSPAKILATFLLETPNLAELQLPVDIQAGTFDLYLFDEGQQLSLKPSAFTLVMPPRPPPPPPPADETVHALVRFIVPSEMVSLVKAGDVDRYKPGAELAKTQNAILTAVRVNSTPASPFDLQMFGGRPWVEALDVEVRLPVRRTDTAAWEYKGQRIRAGEVLRFETLSYLINGTLLRLTPPAPKAPVVSGEAH